MFEKYDVNNIASLVDNYLVSISISEAEVLKVLNSLSPNKSAGIDGIGPKVLKHCALYLNKPLHFLFTLQPTKTSPSHRVANPFYSVIFQIW